MFFLFSNYEKNAVVSNFTTGNITINTLIHPLLFSLSLAKLCISIRT